MNGIDKRQQHQRAARRRHAPAPSRWRIGNATVSTEELQAWQLGPARIRRWLATDGATRRTQE